MNIWQAFIGVIEAALTTFAELIDGMGIPYSWGFAIILLSFRGQSTWPEVYDPQFCKDLMQCSV